MNLLLFTLFLFFLNSIFVVNNQSLFFVDSNSIAANQDGTLIYPYHTLTNAINAQNLTNDLMLSLKTSLIPYQFESMFLTQTSLVMSCEK